MLSASLKMISGGWFFLDVNARWRLTQTSLHKHWHVIALLHLPNLINMIQSDRRLKRVVYDNDVGGQSSPVQ